MQTFTSASDDSEAVNNIEQLGSIKKLILINNIRLKLLEQLWFLNIKAESHAGLVNELKTFFEHCALVELEHGRSLEKILNSSQTNIWKNKNSIQWPSLTGYGCWSLLTMETYSLSKDYNILSEIYNVDVIFKLQKILHIYTKYYYLLTETHEEILRILRNFYTTITTYKIYKKNQCSSDKLEINKSRNIYKHFTETSNADIHKNMLRDLRDIFCSMELGLGLMISKATLGHVNSEQNLFKNNLLCFNENLSRTDKTLVNEKFNSSSLEQNNKSLLKQKYYKCSHKFNQNDNDSIENLLHFEFDRQIQLLNFREKKLRKNLEVIYGILDTREMKVANLPRTENKSINDISSTVDPKSKYLSNSSISTVMKQTAFKSNPNETGKENEVNIPSFCKTRPKLFGGSLEEYLKHTNEKIPLIMRSCIRVISKYGLHSQGIFRVSGSQIEIMNFRESFERGEDPLTGATDASDMNSVAGVLKLYLRELQEPLFPSKYFNFFISLMQLDSEQEIVAQLKHFFKAISQTVVVVIRFLFAFLNHLSEYATENMMDAFNLAISFGPTLMPTPDNKTQIQYQTQLNELIKVIITNHQEVFPKDLVGPRYRKFENYLSDSSNNEAE